MPTQPTNTVDSLDGKTTTTAVVTREPERSSPPAGPARQASAGPNGRDRADDLFVVETRNLTKRYGERIVAVDDLTLRVRHGEVYGFLGPNGAGKTTTLRMLLGLARATSGEAVVAGAPPGAPEGLARIGAMIEAPAFYPFLSGRDNLRVLAKHAGLPESRIDPALAEVELTARAGDRFATYSQGMKQRLGVAAALFKDPELLILDEPTNGLDPAGVAEMRTLIRSLGRGRRTVLLSSHLLGEVEQICDRVGVIRAGRLVAEGTVEELRGQDTLRVRAEPLDAARDLIARLPYVEQFTIDDDVLRITTDRAKTAALNRALVEAGIAVGELHWERPPLEEVFLELTQGTNKEELA
jgi:ABC-type multidrug transport system ATPase subunit